MEVLVVALVKCASASVDTFIAVPAATNTPAWHSQLSVIPQTFNHVLGQLCTWKPAPAGGGDISRQKRDDEQSSSRQAGPQAATRPHDAVMRMRTAAPNPSMAAASKAAHLAASANQPSR